MKRIIKISLILLLVGMAVIAAVPFLKEKRAKRKYENDFKKIWESVTEKKFDVNDLVKKWAEDGTLDKLVEDNGVQPSYVEEAN
mgnify:CR=1 FL=1